MKTLLKVPYYLFLAFLFITTYAGFSSLPVSIITGDFDGLFDSIFGMVLGMFILIPLYFFTRKEVMNTFEFFMFGQYLGIPIGISMIAIFFIVTGMGFIENLPDWTFYILAIVSYVISIPIFNIFARRYIRHKEKEDEKGEKEKVNIEINIGEFILLAIKSFIILIILNLVYQFIGIIVGRRTFEELVSRDIIEGMLLLSTFLTPVLMYILYVFRSRK